MTGVVAACGFKEPKYKERNKSSDLKNGILVNRDEF